MVKNHSEYIKSVKNRTLTAKGLKFLNRCIDIACENKGYTRYHTEMKELKVKLSDILTHLFIDKGLTKDEIIELIKSRKYLN